MNLTTLEILGRVAAKENVEGLIQRFAFLSKSRAEELEVEIRPRPGARDGIRKLPVPAERVTLAAPVVPTTGEFPLAEVLLGTSSPAPVADAFVPPAPLASPASVPVDRPELRGKVEPVAKERWALRVTLDANRKKKLEQLKDLLSHKIPDGDLNAVFEEMLDCAIEKHGKRRGTVTPARTRKTELPPPTPGRRQPIKAWVRRAVLERDGYRCTYLSPDGTRCESTRRLELDHAEGATNTGSSRPDELTVRCRPHNLLRAKDMFGKAHVERRIRESQAVRRAARARAAEGTLAPIPAVPEPGSDE